MSSPALGPGIGRPYTVITTNSDNRTIHLHPDRIHDMSSWRHDWGSEEIRTHIRGDAAFQVWLRAELIPKIIAFDEADGDDIADA